MPLSKEVAARLGVGEDATEADVLAAIGRIEAAAPAKSGSGTKSDDEDDEDDEDEDESSGDRKPAKTGTGGPNPKSGGGKKVAAGEPVVLESGMYQELVEAAELGRKAFARQQSEDHAKVVEAAISEGRIAPASREHFVKLMAADSAGTSQVLASFAPGVIPVAPIGHALSDESSPQTQELTDIHNRVMASFGITTKKAGN